ncbi:hypothetical protein [Vibrio diabolicus]|uniref:hypothetical protein n=1 Tax=Vibrio diabolicus TaxID=50719 RepID=UPI003752BB80
MQILIVGGSKGLGRFLATNLQGKETYTISRSKLVEDGVASVRIDVSPEKKPDYTCFKGVEFDIIVYLASMWGESSTLTTNELIEFMNVGPIGYLNLVNELNALGSLNDKCNIVSIGSTADFQKVVNTLHSPSVKDYSRIFLASCKTFIVITALLTLQ